MGTVWSLEGGEGSQSTAPLPFSNGNFLAPLACRGALSPLGAALTSLAGWEPGGKEQPVSLHRAHRNDMENIFPFLFLGAVYSLLEPSPAVARVHFFIFCVGRIVHTVAYLLKLRAPTRSVAYSVAQLPCFSMALQILLAAAPYW